MDAATAADAVLDVETALDLYRRMLRVRLFEETAGRLYADGEVPGFVHLSIGQEAVAVGACSSLRDTDGIVSTHRGHGHCLAKGADLTSMFAELMGRDSGTCRGLGGSMHIADVERGVYGANGIVGAGLPIAVGVASGFRRQGRDDVVVAFFGDGALAQGAFHEAANLAALWKLPIIFLCENNQYAEFTAAAAQHLVPIVERAASYGMPGVQVDGNDVLAVAGVVGEQVARARAGGGPVLVEAVTLRQRGHYEGDAQRYRPEDEPSRWAGADPIERLGKALADHGAGGAVDEVRAEAEAEVSGAVEAARAAGDPPTALLFDAVWAPAATFDEPPAPEGEEFRAMDAIREALADAFEDDESVWLAGIDVAAGGNIFGLTRGLADRFPGRVLDTPISETAIMGLAVGGAMAGTRPIVELMYLDFLGVCFDQLLNQAAKLRFMTGGHLVMPLVVRSQFGAGRSSGSQHSQSLEALLAHVPGLVVVMPSTPADTYGLLRSAIADPNPVVFIENRLLYGAKGPRPRQGDLVPLRRAVVRRPGTDVTVVTWSRMTFDALDAAAELADDGIDVEVVELRTVSPFDEQTVLASAVKTGRVVVAHEAVGSGGLGAEIAARIADEAFWSLDAPVRRVAAPFTPVPYNPALEQVWLPDRERIVAAVRGLART
jgi:2-oxoisovalerate dehydrogenase E1 component